MLSLDQINEQMNAANPGKIALVYGVINPSNYTFIGSVDEFNPAEFTLIPDYGSLVIYTESQRQLADKEVQYLITEGKDWFNDAQTIICLKNAIIKYLEEQLDFYKDTPFAEVSD